MYVMGKITCIYIKMEWNKNEEMNTRMKIDNNMHIDYNCACLGLRL